MATGSWMSLLWFGVVLALIPGALWLLKRSGLAAGVARGAALGPRLTGSLSLGPQQRVVTVEVGEGAERRWLVLGVTPQQITTLHTLVNPPAVAPSAPLGAAPAGQGSPGFAQVLSSAMGRPARPNPPPRVDPPRSMPAPQPGVPVPAAGQPNAAAPLAMAAVRRGRPELPGADHGV
jgi:flagellar protein FliO/FliZ